MNFRYRIYPSETQIIKLNKTISDCCFIYNKLLEVKVNAYKTDKTNITQFDMNKITKNFDVSIHSQVKQNISKELMMLSSISSEGLKRRKGKLDFPDLKL